MIEKIIFEIIRLKEILKNDFNKKNGGLIKMK